MEFLSTVLLLVVPIIFLAFLLKPKTKRLEEHHRGNAGRLPPGPKNLPFIGSIHHLLRRRPAHRIFRDLSLVYGPIIHLRLGEIPTFIISSSESAKQIMKNQDLAFASRPLTPSAKIICYGCKGLVVAPYTEHWRQMRRLCSSELLSTSRVLSFRSIREEEISLFVRSIAASSGAPVNLSSKFAGLSNNIMTRAVIGGRNEEQRIFLSVLGDVVNQTLSFSAVDLFPSMPKFIGHIAGYRLKRCWLKMDRMLEKILTDHREKKTMNTQRDADEEDLTDVLLRKQQNLAGDIIQSPLSDDHVKAVINDMLMAGSETTSTVMDWVMSELIRNPTVLKKAQTEVREVIKLESSLKSSVSEELITGKLSYLSSVINETLRLHPPVPLLLPRENHEDCEVMGYVIPAGSTVMVNAWAIGRDPNYWNEPEVFRPERFEEEEEGKDNINLKRTNFEFIPFGAGRRSCPGIQFGLSTIGMTLAYLLYYFDWQYVSVKGEEVDMTETFGIAVRRKTQLRLIPTPYFPLPAV